VNAARALNEPDAGRQRERTLRGQQGRAHRGSAVKDLIAAIGTVIDRWNDHPVSFAWTKDADQI
jgi:hypothetical protein